MWRRVVDRVSRLDDGPRPGRSPSGDPARGVVVYHFGDDAESGVSKQWWWRTVDVAHADDPTGPVTRVDVSLTREARRLLRIGTEVPIRVQPGTRVITGIDAEAFEAEALAAEAPAVPEPGPLVSAEPLGAAPPATGTGDVDVVGGVDFGTWVRVEAALATQPVPPAQHDAVAVSLGVAPGTWAAAQAGWQARLRTDWQLAARFGAAYDAATGGR